MAQSAIALKLSFSPNVHGGGDLGQNFATEALGEWDRLNCGDPYYTKPPAAAKQQPQSSLLPQENKQPQQPTNQQHLSQEVSNTNPSGTDGDDFYTPGSGSVMDLFKQNLQ